LKNRPMVMKRYPNGAAGEFFFMKRAPNPRPPWIRTCAIDHASGSIIDFPIVQDLGSLLWLVNLGCIDLNPWPIRATDVDRPDELRVDLDPEPEASWDDVRRVALVANTVLKDHGLVGFPKTSGSRGIHINVRIEPRWSFDDVRRAAVALARETERRAPDIATSAWWKEERHGGVFIDYNQNARDRTVASAYSVRPRPDARVSTPLTWDEVPDVDPSLFTIDTLPERVSKVGDPAADIDSHAGLLDGLLALAARDTENGLPDAPWPPHYPKASTEPVRAQPSRRRK
jgi:bifunctional non-homologous end joining protein LigD